MNKRRLTHFIGTKRCYNRQTASEKTYQSTSSKFLGTFFSWRPLGLKIALQKEKPRDLNMINVYTSTEHMTRKWQENIFEEEENQIIVANCGKLSTATNNHKQP